MSRSLDPSRPLVIPKGSLNSDRPDTSFAPNFERDLPSAYRDMLARVSVVQGMTVPADAIRGFHFTTQHLQTVNPVGGNLYFFPVRPYVRHMQEIGRLAARASGWGGRMSEARIDGPVVVSCVEIAPTADTADKLVTVIINASYGSKGDLMGLGVTADEALTWEIRDSKNILIEP